MSKFKEPTYDMSDYEVMVHEDLATATEELYWAYKNGELTKVQAAQNLISLHCEFIEERSEAKLAAMESWNAYAQFLEDFNR